MKDEAHHLKRVQKRVLRSARRKSGKTSFNRENRQSPVNENGQKVEVYDEVVTNDQQVPRVPTRLTYH